mmetsp:Transcript_76300/g.181448  ORF Transcript_76300/g.181448 Transcript_76300/m.181448 type:complete len:452 (+) Transcript_76300:116-1471(+)|eukprot:CAMPEP_0178401426 /NCGR_PEP_ID=MMETSP0689_2-20121128/16296_1 /TAXON_ID=160604 /ORGANISM="Amphidinium massartii, Strain CS-259" /LENGTH=451 /DNA_ID=CAMNT_0020022247 /DNA_START=109 /DNA_END=1464 /DNA_ORIENTATION=-
MAHEEDPLLDALNAAWSDIKVSTSYNVVYTIAASSFQLTSSEGQLQVVALRTPQDLKKAIAACSTHVIVEKEEDVYSLRTADGLQKGLDTRKVLVNGDGSQVRALCKEMVAYESKASAALRTKASQMGLQLLSDAPAPEKKDLSLPVDLPPGANASIVGADGQMYAVTFEGQKMHKLWQWIHFSAMSTTMGNVGQGNYCAANAFLDTVTFQARIAQSIWQPQTYMWGAVGGIGMRLKAFGSQDMLLFAEEDLLFTIEDAMATLRANITLQNPPEWFFGSLFDSATKASIVGTPAKGEGAAVVSGEDIIYEPSTNKLRVLPTDEQGRNRALRKVLQSSSKRGGDTLGAAVEPLAHIIAGTWDDWAPHNFPWDDEQQCFVFKLPIGKTGSETFSICKGKPSGRRVRSGGKTWKVGLRDPGAVYEVRMFVKDSGSARKVEWEKVLPVGQRVFQE